ncbi:MAG: alanine racemase, partial [Nocardioides sp.]
GGAAPADVPALAERLAAAEGLRLRGVMAVAPPGEDPRPAFEKLARLADEVRRTDPAATWVSAGMSGDLEVAIRTGATHVRIGSAVLGPRPPLG